MTLKFVLRKEIQNLSSIITRLAIWDAIGFEDVDHLDEQSKHSQGKKQPKQKLVEDFSPNA